MNLTDSELGTLESWIKGRVAKHGVVLSKKALSKSHIPDTYARLALLDEIMPYKFYFTHPDQITDRKLRHAFGKRHPDSKLYTADYLMTQGTEHMADVLRFFDYGIKAELYSNPEKLVKFINAVFGTKSGRGGPSLASLRAEAKERGFTGYSGLKKDELIELLESGSPKKSPAKKTAKSPAKKRAPATKSPAKKRAKSPAKKKAKSPATKSPAKKKSTKKAPATKSLAKLDKKTLAKMTVPAIKEYAKSAGFKNYSKLTKEKLIALIFP